MRNIFLSLTLIALMALPLTTVFAAGEVAIYTGITQWIGKAAADEQAEICVDMLNDADIAVTWYDSDGDTDALADWMDSVTGNGVLDICVLYGDFPPVSIQKAIHRPTALSPRPSLKPRMAILLLTTPITCSGVWLVEMKRVV